MSIKDFLLDSFDAAKDGIEWVKDGLPAIAIIGAIGGAFYGLGIGCGLSLIVGLVGAVVGALEAVITSLIFGAGVGIAKNLSNRF